MMKRTIQIVLVLAFVACISPAQSASAGILFFTEQTGVVNSHRISRAIDDGSSTTVLYSQTNTLFRGVDVDLAQSEVFWTDFNSGRIRKLPFSGGSPTNVFQTDYPTGIAVDSLHSKLYVTMDTNVSLSHVMRAGIDGSSPTVVANATGFGYGMKVDPVGGKVYWTTSSRLQRSNLDGTGVQTLSTRTFDGYSGVALDLIHGKVYWSDEDRIHRANLDGTSKVTFVLPGREINDLAIDPIGGALFWTWGSTSTGTGIIEKAGLDGSNPHTIISGLTFPTGIVYAPEPASAGLLVIGASLTMRRRPGRRNSARI